MIVKPWYAKCGGMSRKRFKRLLMRHGNVQGRVAEQCARSVALIGVPYRLALAMMDIDVMLNVGKQIIGFEVRREYKIGEDESCGTD